MKKNTVKFLSAFIAVITLFSVIVLPAGAKTIAEQADVLKSLNVMKGDPNGDLRLEDRVTRAEFTKMVIAMSPVRNSASSGLAVSPFSDVPYTHWAAPYIRLAVTNRYVSGYSDSTFKPDNNVTYAEAVTIVLKLLGYTDDDFGAAWPYGQMGTAENLGLTKDIVGGIDSPLSRGACVILLNNLLDTKTKNAASKYANLIDCNISEGIILIATKNEDPTVPDGKIFTSAGTYKIADGVDTSMVGMRGDAIIRNGDELISFVPTVNGKTEKMAVYSTLGNVVIGYENGGLTEVTVPASTTAYVGATVSNFAQVQSRLNMGTVMTVQRDLKGNVEYVSINEGAAMQGPMIVGSGAWYSKYMDDLSGVTVIRDGAKSSVSALRENDVAYYTSELNMLFVYVKTKTGVYESASPNKDMPTSVTVSGVTYQIEGADAFNALSSNGNIEFGESVTLLLGKDGRVAGAISGSKSNETVYAYVLGTGKKTFADDSGTYSSYYVEAVSADGTKNTYPTKASYKNYANKIVKITFEDGKAALKSVTGTNTVSGTVDAEKRCIGSVPVAKEANILDVSTISGGDASLYKKIFLTRLDGVKLSTSDIVYCTRNSSGEIDNLITLDVTGDYYSYGIVTAVNKETKTFTLDVGGNALTVSGGYTAVSTNMPAKFEFAGGMASPSSLVSMKSLLMAKSNVTELTATEAVCKNGEAYALAENVCAYALEGASSFFKLIPTDTLVANQNDYKITVYYDKSDSLGGRARVILAVKN